MVRFPIKTLSLKEKSRPDISPNFHLHYLIKYSIIKRKIFEKEVVDNGKN